MDNLPANPPADFVAALAHLTSRERLDLEDMKLMILLECAGEPLYQRLAELVDDPASQQLLRQNGREETAHAHRLGRAIEILTGEPFEIPSLEQNPYAAPPAVEKVDAAVLEGVAAGERSGDLSYQRYADHEPNPEVAELLRQNGREESRHGQRVEQVLERMRAAAAR